MNKRTKSVISVLLAAIIAFAAMSLTALSSMAEGEPGTPWEGEFDESEVEGSACSENGHVWGGWVIVEEPDGAKPGKAVDTCTVCGAVETRYIFSDVNDDACPYCGNVHPGFLGALIRFVHLIYKFFADFHF